MTEFQILSAIKNNGGSIEYTALLNLNSIDPNPDPSADKARINQMIANKLLRGKTDAYCLISITDSGRLYLQDACYVEQQNNKLAHDRANEISNQKRHDWVMMAVGAVVAGAVGLAFDLIRLLF